MKMPMPGENSTGKMKRDEMEHLKHQAKRGVKHLEDHHREERREPKDCYPMKKGR
jgi:hypothetical protein